MAESVRGRRSLYAYGSTVLLGILSSAIVLGGVRFAVAFLRAPDMLTGLSRWDGNHYRTIVANGYDYDTGRGSRVAFFPAYPAAARITARLFDMDDRLALTATSQLCLIAALLAMNGYLSARSNPELGGAGESKRGDDSSVREYALLAMALMPTTFFFRMAYSESMFLLAAILALYAMTQSRGALVPAIAVGFATAVRPVGIGLLLPLAWSIRKRSTSNLAAARRFVCLLPLSCWGLLAYMAFQYWKFGQPFAFVLTQEHWHLRPPAPIGERLVSLLSWEPIRNVYMPGAPGYWRSTDGVGISLFSLQFANPIYFLGTVGLVALGAGLRWLTVEELLMSIAFLAIPYFTRGFEMCMASQGRFAAVVFPGYIVLGQLLSRAGTAMAVAILALTAFLMAVYAALFAAGYALI